MGWTVERSPRSKQAFIADRVREQNITLEDGSMGRWVVAHHKLCGDHLWKEVEVRAANGSLAGHFIALDWIDNGMKPGDDPVLRGCWGYKDECESVGPNAYDCPLAYLQRVPPDDQYGWLSTLVIIDQRSGKR